jgi:endonuclease YncB( thermonuclease family)
VQSDDHEHAEAVKPLAALACAVLCWVANAQVGRVIDGDTFIAAVHVWSSSGGTIAIPERIRVLGVNTPEHGEPGFSEATAFTEKWLEQGGNSVILSHCKRDSLLRALAVVTRSDGHNLADDLIAAGLGVKR